MYVDCILYAEWRTAAGDIRHTAPAGDGYAHAAICGLWYRTTLSLSGSTAGKYHWSSYGRRYPHENQSLDRAEEQPHIQESA
jgi:hypothetical protein